MTKQQAKHELRKAVLSRLRCLNKNEIEFQSKLIFQQIIVNSKFRAAKKVGIFMNMPSMEVHTMEIIKHCFESGKLVYLPKCANSIIEGRRLKHLEMIFMPTFEGVLSLIPRGKFNIREPVTGEDLMDSGSLDVLVVPGLAFTQAGQRLGHGAGYYDEFLNSYYSKFSTKPYLIGVGLLQQLVDEVPTEQHDWALDEVIFG